MRAKDYFRSVLETLEIQLIRSMITTFCVALGVFAIVASITAIDVLEAGTIQIMESVGTSSILVERARPERTQRTSSSPLSYDQARSLRQRTTLPLFVSAMTTLAVDTKVTFGEASTAPRVRLVAGDANWGKAVRHDVVEGRGISDDDVRMRRRVVVIGEKVRNQLFGPHSSPIGRSILLHHRLGREQYEVVGVLERKGANLVVGDQDYVVVIPLTVALNRYAEKDRSLTVAIGVSSSGSIPATLDQVVGQLRVIREIRPEAANDFQVSHSQLFEQVIGSVASHLRFGGLLVGLTILLTSGIGVMNVMLISVSERIFEIGLRRSVGARRREIFAHFLAEAFMICQIGFLLGAPIGLLAGNLLGAELGLSFFVPVEWITLAFVLTLAQGVVFGTLPAYRAAFLSPVEALSHE